MPLVAYQKAKTASLFTLATMSGALAADTPAEPWRLLGDRLGEAYQIADDLRDIAMTSEELGKPAGQDAALGRPSAAAQHGMVGAIDKVEGLVRGAIAAVPPCRDPALLKTLILAELSRLLPKELVLLAAAMRMLAAPMATSLGAWARDRIARLQATDGFRRAASAFPLTRPVAKRQARALFDLCAGFVYSQVLLAVVRLRLPERLMAGPRSAAALALELEMTEAATERLLAAAASLRLLALRGEEPAAARSTGWARSGRR